MNCRCVALAALFALGAIPALAHDYKLGAIEINQPWTRATPPTAQAGGGFLVLTNTGTTPDRLVAVKSPACAVRPWNSGVVEVTLARLGKLFLEPTYEIVVKHGSAFDSFQPYDRPSGHRRDSDHPGGAAPAIPYVCSICRQQRLQRNPSRKWT